MIVLVVCVGCWVCDVCCGVWMWVFLEYVDCYSYSEN